MVASVTLFQGDCLDEMKRIADGSVDLTVTSPPYDNLRTYNNSLNDWTEAKWQSIIAELYRVTKDGGVVVWVVGDATVKGSETGTSFRQALHALACGFNLHDTIIWNKPNPMPGGAKDQYQSSHEYMFVWSRGRPTAANILREACQTAGAKNTRIGSSGANGWTATTGERIVRDTKRRSNVWSIPKSHNGGGHPAVFPDTLAQDHILSWSNEGDTVLDPFLGSGTTGKMAALNRRNFIGIERDPQYFTIAERRIQAAREPDQPSLIAAE